MGVVAVFAIFCTTTLAFLSRLIGCRNQDDIEATRQVLTAFKQLLNEGDKVECIDAWAEDEDRPPTLLGEMAVNLAAFPGDHFRFFSGYRFELKNET